MLNNRKFNPPAQLALLLVFVGISMIFFSLLTGLFAKYVMDIPVTQIAGAILKPENSKYNMLLQIFSSFFVFGLPSILLASICGPNPMEQLGCNDLISGKQAFFVILMIVAAIMLSGALGEVNHMIPLPKNLAAYFQTLEDQYNKSIVSLANMKTTNDYIFSLFVLAVTPALFEEILFRGCMQQIMVSITKKPFVGILITSIIFSAAHFSYYGFLPRLFLGLLLGYIFYTSKNLWLSILGHLLYNGFGVTQIYSLSRTGKLTEEAMQETAPLYYGLIGSAIIIMLFIAFKKESDRILLQQN